MAKKVAVLVVNPVNGAGLFQYLETFFENGIPYRTFAVADSVNVKTNSGISMQTDDVVSNLKGHQDEYDALVFSCGDAVPKYMENQTKQFNRDMVEVIKAFHATGKILIGHCAAAFIFDHIGLGDGQRVAQHPYIKGALKGYVATDEKAVAGDKLLTAQTENTIADLIPEILKALE